MWLRINLPGWPIAIVLGSFPDLDRVHAMGRNLGHVSGIPIVIFTVGGAANADDAEHAKAASFWRGAYLSIASTSPMHLKFDPRHTGEFHFIDILERAYLPAKAKGSSSYGRVNAVFDAGL